MGVLATLLLCWWGALAQVSSMPENMPQMFESARKGLTEAFVKPSAQSDESNQLIWDALRNLEKIHPVVAWVIKGGGDPRLHDEHGEFKHFLSVEEQAVLQEYLDGYVFVFPESLPLVLAGPGVATLLEQEETHVVLRRRTLLHFLRISWWKALSNPTGWVEPLFGALAALAHNVRFTRPPSTDRYRELLWNATDGSERRNGPLLKSLPLAWHLQIIEEPLRSWEYTRAQAYRKACAWLAVAKTRSAIEAAERHVKAHWTSTLRSVLHAAAEWPIFDFLHAFSMNASNLEDDVAAVEEHPQTQDEDGEETVTPRCQGNMLVTDPPVQRLSPQQALEVYRMVHVFGQLCDTYGIRWWASHGTLIGALRDLGLSRHADDCEVDVAEDDVEILQGSDMKAALSRNGYELSYDPRGQCFKLWPAGSKRVSGPELEDVLLDQTAWLPQQFVGQPVLDVYVVETPDKNKDNDRHYISNSEFHCNSRVCSQVWRSSEISSTLHVPFGVGTVAVPLGAAGYLRRVYGEDWNTTVRPHRWGSEQGCDVFAPVDARSLGATRRAEPTGPLPMVVLP